MGIVAGGVDAAEFGEPGFVAVGFGVFELDGVEGTEKKSASVDEAGKDFW